MTFQMVYHPPSQTTQILLVQVEVTLSNGDRGMPQECPTAAATGLVLVCFVLTQK